MLQPLQIKIVSMELEIYKSYYPQVHKEHLNAFFPLLGQALLRKAASAPLGNIFTMKMFPMFQLPLAVLVMAPVRSVAGVTATLVQMAILTAVQIVPPAIPLAKLALESQALIVLRAKREISLLVRPMSKCL